MSLILRWAGRAAACLILLAVTATALLLGAVWWTLPARDGRFVLPGLSTSVEVAFDGYGIPHVTAASEADAWTTLGWLHARDRMFQMDAMRRGAAGRLAEITGAPAVRLDRYMRMLGLVRRAEADLAALPPEARRSLEAYAAGVNAWITARGRFAGPEFVLLGAPEPWQPVDSLLWGKVMGLWLSGNWRTELERARLGAILPPDRLEDLWPIDTSPGRPDEPSRPRGSAVRSALPDHSAATPRLDGLAGLVAQVPAFPLDAPLPAMASNAWTVTGPRAARGAPLLASDPHLGYSAPILWYLARIELPDGHVLAGATAPGVPGIVIGRNERLAWGFTTTHSDTQDIFVERLAGPDAYQTPDGPRPFSTREEVIQVRWGNPVTVTVRETRHGPVISDLDAPQGRADGTVLALAMASLAPDDTAAAGLLALNGARSIEAARDAARLISSPAQNLMVADAAGGIALYLTGRVPLRRSGDGSLPVPGWDGRADWDGFLPFSTLPHVENPASNLLANANNRIVPPGHPAYLGRDWFGDWRFRRIGAMLAERPRLEPSDFSTMQGDTVSLFAREVLPAILAAPRPDGAGGAAFDLLAAWDGSMEGQRPQPLIFHAMLGRFARDILARAGMQDDGWRASPEFLYRLLTVPERGQAWCGPAGCGPLLSAALGRAVSDLAPIHGPDPSAWRWAAAHQARFEHALFRFIPGIDSLTRLVTPSAGDGETVNRAGLRAEAEGQFGNIHGAGFRGVFDLSDPAGAWVVIATGQSGHPMSRHWSDLLPAWRDGALLRLGPIEGEPAGRLRLLP